MLARTQNMRRLRLRAALKAVELPLRPMGAVFWWLEGIRARLQTALANEEARR